MYFPLVDVAIIGAGPWGLGLATHLRSMGVDHRIFGSPMQTWRDMPENMNLKSLGFATSIPVPGGHPTFPEFCRARGLEDYEPIEFQTFADYGMQIQREFVPYVEDTLVTGLERMDGAFRLTLESGEQVHARRVVVAVGLGYFQRLPKVLEALPAELRSHTWGPKDFGSYAGQDVVVVGGGSSAMETAVLLHEHGARVEVLARTEVRWGGRGTREWERSLIDRVRMPISTVGHGRENWVLEHVPWLMHYLPASKRIPFTRTHLGPVSAWWLADRGRGRFPVSEWTSVVAAVPGADRVRLRVQTRDAGARELVADHVIAGTGYEPDVDRIPFLDPSLAANVRRYDRAPRLSRHFESSVSGLYFMGPIAAFSFGPLVRFVAGAYFAIPTIAGHLSVTRGRTRHVPSATATGLMAAVTTSQPSAPPVKAS
ncbi:MAG: NAD(P)-binding domain-containing protein [Chloroflexi bacterium]|nr:NAD(P)-binding domain-containing protein [Chloroflexota bacterium]